MGAHRVETKPILPPSIAGSTSIAELGSLEYPGKEHGWPDEWVDRQGPLNILSP
jgi:hypothetical protein